MGKRKKYIQTSTLSVATLLLVYAALTSTPATLARGTQDILAAVGVSVGVSPNPYNTVAQQLNDKEAQLNAREAELLAQEQKASPFKKLSNGEYGFYSLCMSVALFVLVAINFYFDTRRRKVGGSPQRKLSVDLR